MTLGKLRHAFHQDHRGGLCWWRSGGSTAQTKDESWKHSVGGGGGEEKPSVAEVRLGSKPLLTFWGPAALGGGCRAWALQNQMALRMLILELPGKSGTQEPVRRLLPEKDQA